jgi:hypothetical protein
MTIGQEPCQLKAVKSTIKQLCLMYSRVNIVLFSRTRGRFPMTLLDAVITTIYITTNASFANPRYADAFES